MHPICILQSLKQKVHFSYTYITSVLCTYLILFTTILFTKITLLIYALHVDEDMLCDLVKKIIFRYDESGIVLNEIMK